MTIPTLMTKIQNRMFVAQLKKEYSTLQQGFRMMLAQEGVEALSHTECGNEWGFLGAVVITDKQRACWSKVLSGITFINNGYFKLHEGANGNMINSIKYLNGSNVSGHDLMGAFYMPSGAEIGFYCDLKISESVCEVGIDVNGDKAPNTMGRDIFFYHLYDNATMVPFGRVQLLTFYGQVKNWKEDSSLCGTAGSKTIASSVKGYGCAARIMDEGWQMNY